MLSKTRWSQWVKVPIACLIIPVTALALEQNELDTHRAEWNSHNISDYDYIMRWGSRRDLGTDPALVSVRKDTIVAAVDPDTLTPYNPHDFLTINQSFDVLQHALDVSALEIMADFDAFLGYPRFVRIVYRVPDDVDFYRADNLLIVPEPSGATLLALALLAMGVTKRACGSRGCTS